MGHDAVLIDALLAVDEDLWLPLDEQQMVKFFYHLRQAMPKTKIILTQQVQELYVTALVLRRL